MKRLLTLFMLSSFFMQNHGMESSFSSSIVPDEKVIIIQTTDSHGSTIEFPVKESVIKESVTIKNILEDMDLKEEEIRIPLDKISTYDFKTLVPYLERVAAIKYKIEKEQSLEKLVFEKLVLIRTLKTHSIDELVAITNHANFLDIPILLECCINAISQKITKDNIQQICGLLPLDIIRSIVKQCIINKGLIDTEPLAQCNNHTNSVNSVCAIETDDGWRIISGSSDNTIRIWDMKGKQIAQCNGHPYRVSSVCAIETDDGWRIISGSWDNTIRIWDMSGNQLTQCDGHTDEVDSVCAIETDDGWRIISGSWDNTIRIWDMSGNQLTQCDGHTDGITSVCAIETDDGWRIISGSWDRTTRIWDMHGNQLAQCIGLTSSITVCAVETNEGCRIISGSSDNTIRIWDMSGKQLAQCIGHRGSIWSVCAVQTDVGWRIISGSSDKTIRIWDMHGKQLAQCNDHTDQVNSVYVTKTDNDWRIFSGSSDKTICIWHTISLFDKLNTITGNQAIALCKALDTISDSSTLYREIKRILNPPGFFNLRRTIAIGILGTTAAIVGYFLYTRFKK